MIKITTNIVDSNIVMSGNQNKLRVITIEIEE